MGLIVRPPEANQGPRVAADISTPTSPPRLARLPSNPTNFPNFPGTRPCLLPHLQPVNRLPQSLFWAMQSLPLLRPLFSSLSPLHSPGSAHQQAESLFTGTVKAPLGMFTSPQISPHIHRDTCHRLSLVPRLLPLLLQHSST